MTAGVKVGLAIGAVYGAYRLYTLSQNIKEKSEVFESGIDAATTSTKEFFTETINPVSSENFIKQSVVGEVLTPVFNNVFHIFGVGK